MPPGFGRDLAPAAASPEPHSTGKGVGSGAAGGFHETP